MKNHQIELEEVLDNIDINCYYSIYVNFVSLFEDDADVAQKILQYPRYYLPLCDEAAIKAQEEIAKPKQIVKKKVMPSRFVIKIYNIFIIAFLKYI